MDKVSKAGDNSIMEMQPVCFAVENISILAGLLLTDPRLGWSPQERSTRRQKMYPCKESTLDGWADYEQEYGRLYNEIQKNNPTWSTMAVRDAVCDQVRGLIPVNASTAIAVTCNVRSLAACFHNLRHERFAGLPRDHPVFNEITELRSNLIMMVTKHCAGFKRKFDDAHDTFVDDPTRVYRACSFVDFAPFHTRRNMCMKIDVSFNSERSAFFNEAYVGPAHERVNRHGDIPIVFETTRVSGELCAPLSVFREFKRHRGLINYDTHICNDGPLILETPVFWRFTGTLGCFMLSAELRTEDKAHADIRQLYADILRKLYKKVPWFHRMHDTFFFTDSQVK